MDKLSTRIERAMAQAVSDHSAEIVRIAEDESLTKAQKAKQLDKLNEPGAISKAMQAAREAVVTEDNERIAAEQAARAKREEEASGGSSE